MAEELTTALLPVFVTLAVGYAAGWRGLVDNQDVESLNRLVMTFAVPVALFASISSTQPAEIVSHLGFMAVFAISMALVYAGTWWLERRVFRRDQGSAAVQALTVAFPNLAAVGLPLSAAVVGPPGAIAVAIGLAIGAVTVTPLTLALLDAEARDADAPGSALAGFGAAWVASLRKPVFWAPMLAFVLVLSGLRVPREIESSLSPLSAAAAGVALFLTGLILSAQRPSLDAEVGLGVVAKNAVMPLMVWGWCVLLGLSELVTTEAVLLAAAPSGFFGVVFAASHGIRPRVSGSTILVSTLAAVGSLAVVVALLPQHV